MKTAYAKTPMRPLLAVWLVVLFVITAPDLQNTTAQAGMRQPPPDKIDVIMVGDRVVDIAYNLGVMPRAMSVRGSQWEMAKKLRLSSQLLGCPMFTTVKKKQTIPDALKKFGINRVIAEKTDTFCLYKPQVKPESIADIVKGTDTTVDYVDFSKGLESAVRQVAKLIGREEKVDELLAVYNKNLDKARQQMPTELGKKVIILNGVYQHKTGKISVRVEAPGLYSDRFFLTPMGCTNIGDAFKPANGKMVKGYYPVRKNKSGLLLEPLLKANPDLIVITGNAYAVQKALIKQGALFHLPLYVNSSVLEFPRILLQWATAFK